LRALFLEQYFFSLIFIQTHWYQPSYLSNPVANMGKSKSAAKNGNSSLPKAPWLYVNDTISDNKIGDEIVTELVSLIPKADTALPVKIDHYPDDACWKPLASSPDDTIVIVVDRQSDLSRAVQTANAHREKTIELGKNFTSVKLTSDSSLVGHGTTADWGTNHLELNTAHLTAQAAAERIFKWLCKLLLLAHFLALAYHVLQLLSSLFQRHSI